MQATDGHDSAIIDMNVRERERERQQLLNKFLFFYEFSVKSYWE